MAGLVGDITHIAPPPSVEVNELVSESTMSIFVEQTGYELPVELSVDILGAGRADNGRDPQPAGGTIPAGTRVDVYYVHFDSPAETVRALFGGIGFGTEVLGAIHSDALLDDSDFLGAPGTSYPTGAEFRGMVGDLEGMDWVEVLNSPMGPPTSVQINSNVEFVLDGVRIITAPGGIIPEPTTAALASVGAIGMLLAGRRRRPCSPSAA